MKPLLKIIIVALILPATFTVLASTNFEDELQNNFSTNFSNQNNLDSSAQLKPNQPLEISASCTFKSERSSGNNKICTYSCLTGDKAINVSALKQCPLYIN